VPIGANHLASVPTAVYSFVLLMAGVAYYILERAIIRQQGPNSLLAKAIGNRWKENVSPLCYFAAIPLAFMSSYLSQGLFIFVAILWLVPDRRIERVLNKHKKG
jgi:uncharacterized membrane protein